MHTFKFALAASMIGLAGCATPPPSSNPDDYGPEPTNVEQIIRAYMDRALKDPGSAQVRFDRPLRRGWYSGQYGWVQCLQINAKNSFGGYNGFRPNFFFIKHGRVIAASHGDGGYGDLLVNARCNS